MVSEICWLGRLMCGAESEWSLNGYVSMPIMKTEHVAVVEGTTLMVCLETWAG